MGNGVAYLELIMGAEMQATRSVEKSIQTSSEKTWTGLRQRQSPIMRLAVVACQTNMHFFRSYRYSPPERRRRQRHRGRRHRLKVRAHSSRAAFELKSSHDEDGHLGSGKLQRQLQMEQNILDYINFLPFTTFCQPTELYDHSIMSAVWWLFILEAVAWAGWQL